MTNDTNKIAIIGRALRVPGAATPRAFWNNIARGVGSCTKVDEAALRAAGVSAAELADPRYVRVSASFGDEALFDADLFQIPPSEAELIDPQQRLLLECARAALEDSGYVPERTAGSFGVFAGVGPSAYFVRNIGPRPEIVERMGMQAVLFANDKSYCATRIAFKLNLHGPACAVDSACSTGLVAVHTAARSLLDFECDFALAGAASILAAFQRGYRFDPGSILSPNGLCRFLDAEAQGTLFGSGAAVVVLRRYEDALAAGDHIHGVILGSAVNNDGRRKAGFSSPSVDGQADVIALAQEAAGVGPEALGYVECHGTGTQLGDPIELSALSDAFGGAAAGSEACALGSVKPNIGHLDVAAGLVGMINAMEVVRRGELPPLLNFERLNPAIDLAQTPFFVPQAHAAWRHGASPRRAGVSAFGIGGTNAHLILEQPPTVADHARTLPEDGPVVLPLSANTGESLRASLAELAQHFESEDGVSVNDAAFTLQVGRWELPERAAVVASSAADAVRALRGEGALLRGRRGRATPPVVFMFPGQGAQYLHMARELYRERAPFRAAFDACAAVVQRVAQLDLVAHAFDSDDARAVDETALTQPLLFAIEYAYAALARAAGVQPSACIGHSVGEYVAAQLAGVFSLEDVLSLVVLRGKLMQSLPRGAMLAVALPEAEALRWTSAEVSLAAVNAANRCVLSGTPSAIEALRERLEASQVEARVLHTSHAFHSAMLDPILSEFRAGVARCRMQAPQLPFVSNLTGEWITPEQATSPSYWVDHLRNTVRFADGVERLLEKDPELLLLEVGPGTTLTRLVSPRVRGRAASLGRAPNSEQSDRSAFLAGLAALWVNGLPLEWERVREREGRRVPLPTYAYDRKRFWIDPPAQAGLEPVQPESGAHAVLDWVPASLPAQDAACGTWLVFDDERELGAALSARVVSLGGTCLRVVPADAFARLDAHTFALRPGEAADYAALRDAVTGVDAIVSLWPSHPQLDALRSDDKGLRLAREVATIGATLHADGELAFAMVTRAGAAVSPDPAMASVFGAMRALAHGQRGLRCAAIDVAAPAPWRALADAIVQEVTAKLPEWCVALQAGERLVRRPRAAQVTLGAAPLLRRRGVYLVTGGFGELGGLIARSLAAKYAARVILLGRSEVPAPRHWPSLAASGDDTLAARMARLCLEVQSLGGEVLALRADVSDTQALQRAVAEAEATFGPIQGVIHAAGVLRASQSLGHAEHEHVFADEVFAAKARGACETMQLLAARELDFVAFMSSTTAVLGAFAQLEYCAANAYLDALAQSLAARGVRAISIAWDTWKSAGMSQRMKVPAGLEAFKAKLLAAGFDDEEGVAAFHALLVEGVPAYVIASKAPFVESFARGRQLSELVVSEQPLMAASESGDLESNICRLARSVLGVADIQPTDTWFNLGADSLLVGAIFRQLLPLAPKLELVDLFAHPSPRALSRFLLGERAPAPVVAPQPPSAADADIAIIAFAGRFPGADSVEALWEQRERGESGFRQLTPEQLIENGLSDAEARDPARVPAVGMLSSYREFDTERFGFTAREALLTDPQQRVFLECALEALERAGYAPSRSAANIALYAGSGASTYLLGHVLPSVLASGQRMSGQSLAALELGVGNDAGFFATRVAYKLGLRGAAVTVNTACSTSLVAVHHACRALAAGDCDMALAGGARVDTFAEHGYVFEEGGLQSAHGQCRTFDAGAAGTVFGSGAGVVLLKRLDRALADGDTVHAVIKASAINNDGPERAGFSAPNVEGQRAVIEAALARSAISARDIGYVEAHGTGTALGDPIEVRALTAAFRGSTSDRQYCALGAVKPNIGHLDAASGIAGLLSAVGVLQRRRFPPSLHFEAPNPLLALEQTPFFVPRVASDWDSSSPRVAVVSSFGLGGTNAHVIVQEAPAVASTRPAANGAALAQAFVWSAPSEPGLEALRTRFAELLSAGPQLRAADVAYTLQLGREQGPRRMAVVCDTLAEAGQRLVARELYAGHAPALAPSVVFMFPGQGAQFAGMAADLHATEPVFRAAFEACFEAWSPADPDLARSLLLGERRAGDARVLATSFAQPALFCMEYALAKLLASAGVVPGAMIGHSVGEYVAAQLAGVFSLEDAVQLVAARGALMETAPHGVMLSVPLPAAEVRGLCELDVAAINGPALTIVSGTLEDVARLEAELTARGVESRRLHTAHAFHSRAMDSVLDAFEARVAQVARAALSARVVSNVTGSWLSSEQACDPAYWRAQLRQTVMFWEGLRAAASEPGTLLVEVGPGGALNAIAKQADLRGTPSVRAGCRYAETVHGATRYREALARLWVTGVDVDWAATHHERCVRVQLPTYVFQRKRYWIEAPSARAPEVTLEQREPAEREPECVVDVVRTPTEEVIHSLWAEAFGDAQLGLHDDFFELGGQSLLAARLVGRIRKHFGVELPLRVFFERATIFGVAQRVDEALATAQAELGSSVPRLAPGAAPVLSFAQERMWFMQKAAPEATPYNIVAAFSLRGALDIARLEDALRAVLLRHDALRAAFPDRDGHVRVVLRPAADVLELELRPMPGVVSREHVLRTLFVAEAKRPFDLAADRLVRVALAKTGDDEHLLLFIVHHIAADAWSLRVIARDTIACYSQAHASLPALGVGYFDHAAWQRHRLATGELEADRAYWLAELTPLPAPVDLPQQGQRPAQPSYRGRRHIVHVPQAVVERLRQLSGEHDASLFIGMLAAFQVLLARYANQEEITLGIPVANRGPVETHDLVGLFVNTLVLRGSILPGATFSELLSATRTKVLEALAHQELPFEQLVSELKPARDLGRNPFFDILFSFVEAPLTAAEVAGVEFVPVQVDLHTARLDLAVEITETSDATLRVELEYASDLFSASFIEQLAAHYLELLDRVSTDPQLKAAEIALLSSAEQHHILRELNQTAHVRPAGFMSELLDAQAQRTPNLAALTFAEHTISYADLQRRSRLLTQELRALGIGSEQIVAVYVERSIEMVVALHGVTHAGAAFLPIEPSYPQARVAYMLADSGAAIVLTQARFAADLPADVPRLLLDAELDWDAPAPNHVAPTLQGSSLAYVIYTSGSTGQPKAAMNTHAGLSNRVQWMQEAYTLDASDVVLQKTPFTFDVSVWEFFWPLITGARLVVAQPGEHQDSARLVRTIRHHGITTLHFVPSMLRAFLLEDGSERCTSLRQVMSSGEALTANDSNAFYARLGARLHNLYGPTEAAIDVTAFACEPNAGGPIPIGRPITNVRMYVLDQQLSPVPLGVTGDLYIGGVAVGRGYLRRAALTADRFVPDPFGGSGDRLYATGDRARYRSDGEIEFLGRLDHQLKIRGLRIETGEIEAVLAQFPGVRTALVLTDDTGNQLLGYVVVDGGSIDLEPLRAHLRQHLPSYMLPNVILPIASIPVTANGKLDRRALPQPSATPTSEYVEPATPVESALALIWAKLLKKPRVGRHDNFFELGGDSIIALQVAGAARRQGYEFEVRQLLELQTLSDLAAVTICKERPQAEQGPVVGDAPLAPIQRWFLGLHASAPSHWNQAVLLDVRRALDIHALRSALEALYVHHDALRVVLGDTLRFRSPEDAGGLAFEVIALPDGTPEALVAACDRANASLDLARGPVFKATAFTVAGELRQLLLVAHHIAIDVVSWRVLAEDLEWLLSGASASQLPAKTTSYKAWLEALAARSCAPEVRGHAAYWASLPWQGAGVARWELEPCAEAQCERTRLQLPAADAQALSRGARSKFGATLEHALFAALSLALAETSERSSVIVQREAHGREELAGLDCSRTVGWFTALTPVALPIASDPRSALKAAKEELRRVAAYGDSYGLLRYGADPVLAHLPEPQICLNFLGEVGAEARGALAISATPPGQTRDPQARRGYLLELDAQLTAEGDLALDFAIVPGARVIEPLAFMRALRRLIELVRTTEKREFTPTDFSHAPLNEAAIARITATDQVEQIYPLVPMQAAFLVRALAGSERALGIEHMSCIVVGQLDRAALREAWQTAVQRHEALRSSFVVEHVPAPVRVVSTQVVCDLSFEPSHQSHPERGTETERISALIERDRERGFDLSVAPLFRVTALQLAPARHCILFTYHHAILDGWSLPLLLGEVLSTYNSLANGRPLTLERPQPYALYLAALARRGDSSAQLERYWETLLRPFDGPTLLPTIAEPASRPRATSLALDLGADLLEQLNALTRRKHVTLNTIVQGAWALLLADHTQRTRVLFGKTVSGRELDADGMVGMFMNVVPMVAELPLSAASADWLVLLQQAQHQQAAAEHVPLARIQEVSHLPPSTGLFDSVLVFQNYPQDGVREHERELKGIALESVDAPVHTAFRLTLCVLPQPVFRVSLAFDAAQVCPSYALRVLHRLQAILQQFAEQPERELRAVRVLAHAEHAELEEHALNHGTLTLPQGTRVYVVSAAGAPLPCGVPGRLWTVEPGQAFQHGHLSALHGRRALDGTLQLLAPPLEHRGATLLLADIEAVLGALPEVLAVQATIVGAERRLVAGVLVAEAARLAPESARERLAAHLPASLLPERVVVTADLARHAHEGFSETWLEELLAEQARTTRLAPANATEARLLELWSGLLGTTDIGVEDDFLALGGRSVAVLAMIARIGSAFEVRLTVREVFSASTVRGIASVIDQKLQAGASSASTVARELERSPIVRDDASIFPLSPYQLPEWFYHELAPDSPMYNIFEAMYFHGPLDLEAFRRACEALVARHAALRTTIDFVDGTPSQRVATPRPLALEEFYEARLDVPEAEISAHAQATARRMGAQTLDFANGPLFQWKLVGYANDCYLFAFLTNHIVWDELSSFVLGRELAHFYNAFHRGTEPSLPRLRFGYGDYAAWVNRAVEQRCFEAQRQYWLQRFSPLPLPLELPLDFPRPPQLTFNGAEVHRVLPAALVQRMQALLATRPGLTMTSLLTATFGVVLHKLSGQNDIVVGVPYANRGHESLEGIVGPFATALPIRLRVAPDLTFLDLLEETRQTYLDALDNADYPSVLAIRELDPPTDHARPRLFSVMMGLQNDKQNFWRDMAFDDIAIANFPSWREIGPYNTSSRTDLRFLIDQFGDSFVFLLSFNTDLFARESVERWADYLLSVMEHGAEEPSSTVREFLLASPAERALGEARNDTREEFASQAPIHQMFEQLAVAHPHAIASDDGVTQLSYGELNERANRWAHALVTRGVNREDRVGVLFEPSHELVVALLAILKAGAAYVPLSPEQPKARHDVILAQASAQLVLSTRALAVTAPTLEQGEIEWLCMEDEQELPAVRGDLLRTVHPSNTACVFFTSGSTGVPKGILVEHKGISNLIASTQSVYGLERADATLFITPYTFDVSLLDVFWPLAVGARVVIPSGSDAKDPREIARWVTDHDVTTLQCVPVLLDALVDARERGSIGPLGSLRFVMCAGAALPRSLAQRCHAAFAFQLANHYGPTEATVDVSRFDTVAAAQAWSDKDDLADEIVPIGRPVSNTELHVVDPTLMQVPMGAVGELCIASVQLARGYLNDPEKTALSFVPNPFGPPGSRMYRTGDLTKVTNQNVLSFLGRVDRQVKVRGNRVELEDVETCLSKHPAVSRTAIIHRKDASGTDSLAAFVELREGMTTIVHESETYRLFTLAQRPDLMRATEIIHAESWPEYFAGNLGPQASWPRLNGELPGYQVAITDADDRAIAIVNTAPLAWSGRNADIPAGWDAALAESLQQFDAGMRPNTLLVLAGAITREGLGRGLSALVVRVFKHLAARWGLEHVLAPVRPNGKVAAVTASASEWSERRRADGQLEDAWMRVHERAGGVILRADDESQLVQGTFEDWQRWLGVSLESLPLVADSMVLVPRALAPVVLDRARETAQYIDPCVWMRHAPHVAWPDVVHVDAAALRHWMSERVPAYMVPDQLRILASMPLTSTAKIDLRALPQLEAFERARIAPETDAQRALARIWDDILKTTVGVTDDFYELGGHSLRAVQMLARIEAEFDIRIPLSLFLRNASIVGLEKLLQTARPKRLESRSIKHAGTRNESESAVPGE